MIRPPVTVLSDSEQIPDRNLIVPPPNRFTHELSRSQEYAYTLRGERGVAAGSFAAGTQVLLIRREGDELCRVADARGLYVVTEFSGLRKL